MASTNRRFARLDRVFRRDTADVTDQTLIDAPTEGHIVIDFLFYNTDGAGLIEFKDATGGIADFGGNASPTGNGILAGAFGANGGFVSGAELDMRDDLPLVWSHTGGAAVRSLTILYHVER